MAFNECCVAAIAALNIKLAAQLASFNAKFEAWKSNGSNPSLRPKGKEGNIITRAYAKTGWWPLTKDSVLWQQAIGTLGPLAAPTKHKLTDKAHKFADLGDKRIKIRSLVLESFQNDFINKAHAVEEKAKQTRRRKAARISIENTYCGKGFCKQEDLQRLAEAKARKIAEAKEKEERVKAKQKRTLAKQLENMKALDDAKGILAKYQHDRSKCEKKLSCTHLVLLLRELGHEKEAYARNGKRLLQADLRQLYWRHHIDVVWRDPENTTDESENSIADSDLTIADSELTTADSEPTIADSEHTTAEDSEHTTVEDSENSSLWDDTDEESVKSVTFQVGDKIEVYWPGDRHWYVGVVNDIDQSDSTFEVHYKSDDKYCWHDITWKVKVV